MCLEKFICNLPKAFGFLHPQKLSHTVQVKVLERSITQTLNKYINALFWESPSGNRCTCVSMINVLSEPVLSQYELCSLVILALVSYTCVLVCAF